MKAVCWQGANKVAVETVPDPKILNPRDAIVKITSTAICGSDLHLYDGFNPTMQPGDILGHEFMGEIVELGSAIKNSNPSNGSKRLAVGDRVVVPFTIACGSCFFCTRNLWSLCDNSNPNVWMAEKLMGHSPSGLFGYSHLTGGYAGGQAEYARVPFADVGLFKIPDGLADDQVLFLTDIFPTGYMVAENCDIQPGDTVAIWGCGPVGQFAIRSAYMLGAERVIAIDFVPERLQMAKEQGKAEVLNYEEVDVGEALKEMTGGRGPDSVMDAVGMEAHGAGLEGFYDRVKQAARLETDRPTVLRQAIVACRKGGTVSVPGVYTGLVDKIPMGAFMNKGLTMKTGQTHLHRYLRPLLERIQNGDIEMTPNFRTGN
jgi:threonine dehydrogenase-like Zn-dependent dehydrogenase